MALQLSLAIRNAMLNQIEPTVGSSATLEIRTGAVPANCAAPDQGTVVATINLPADFFLAASAGVLDLTGTWEDTSADADGIAGHFRMKDSGGTCHLQGDVGQGSGDLQVTNTNFATGQPFTVTAFQIGAPNA